MNYSYNVNAYFEKAETTLRTNDVNVAIREFMDYIEDDVTCDIVNGFTGEVLAIANNPNHENYCTNEVALMMLGVLYDEQWGEEDDTEDEMVTAESLVLALVNELAESCPAIKCKVCGLPS